jgi:two-component system phosphate regulon sensor histidine kinase PhoR
LLLELEETPAIAGDGDRLVQVLTNLVDNALRYTPAGGQVTLAVHPIAGQAPAGGPAGAPTGVRISITDTGPGIPPAELSRLFERFYQVDKSRARKKGGTGLGLAIAKEIVEAHHGVIRVESIEGLGTRFVVELPAVGAT